MATYSAEVDPLTLIKETIEAEWDNYEGKIPKPQIGLWNELGRVDSRSKYDFVTIAYSAVGEEETWEGHAKEYKNTRVRIEIGVWTTQSRQRMHDVKAEIRRIMHRKKVDLYDQGWQIISYLGFVEDPEPTVRNWRGTITVEMDSAGLILDTGE